MSDNKTKIFTGAGSILFAIVCCALWGSAFPFIKIGYSLFNIESSDTASQILFAGLRFTFAGLSVIVIGSIASKKALLPTKHNIGKICTLSVFQTILQYIFFYIGLAHTTGTKGSVINSTSVFFAVIISSIIFKQDKMTAKKIIGCVAGFAGTVIINLTNLSDIGNISFLGEGFILISSLSYAVSSVLIKKYSSSENPVTLSGWQFVFGGIFMSLFAYVLGGRISYTTAKGIILLAYLAMLSAVAYTLWGVLLKYNDVSKIAVFGFMTPVFGCIFSAAFLKENFAENALKTFIALLFVCAGIIMVNKKDKNTEIKNES